ncbi:MAG: RcpC/CpaB family pilus assembly protein [Bacilli bacterium]|nr:RcpC/CpaB family pilus assembly protein [Bacilli bacterium]
MKFKGRLKDKLFSVLFLLIAIGITYYIYTDAKSTREEITIPVITRDLKYGELISVADIGTAVVGKYKLDPNIVVNKEDIIGKYAIKDMYQGRFYYRQDISNVKPPTEISEKIEEGAIAIETNLVKCVGGIPKEGDYVKVNIIKKADNNQQLMEVIQFPELSRLKILDIRNNNAESIHKEKQTTGLGSVSSTQTKPDLIIFEVNKEQETKLLLGQYTGDIHLVLLPKDKDVIVETEGVITDSINITNPTDGDSGNFVPVSPTNGNEDDDEGYDNKPLELVPNIPSTKTPQPPKDAQIKIEESNDFDIAP